MKYPSIYYYPPIGPLCYVQVQTSNGEWNEAVWKEVSFILSQKIPFGGFVCTKNIPVDHLSSRKLQVPSFVFTLFTTVRGHYAALTYNCSEDLKDSISQGFIEQAQSNKLLQVHLEIWMEMEISTDVDISRFSILMSRLGRESTIQC